jgi:hypothetical protein
MVSAASTRALSLSALVMSVVLGVCTNSTRADPAPGVTFTKIADTSTLIPAGQWAGQTYQYFDIPGIDHGEVVFTAAPLGANGARGVYSWRDGAIGLVADQSTPLPGGGSVLNVLGSPAVQGGEYAFADWSHIYRTDGGTLTTVPSLTYGRIASYALDGPDVWFNGYRWSGSPGGPIDVGIYRSQNGEFARVVAEGQPIPDAPHGQTFYFSSSPHRVVAVNGRAVFWANGTHPTGGSQMAGLYEYNNGTIARVVDSTMIAPGGTTPFEWWFSAFDQDGERVVVQNGRTMYIEHNGEIETLAASGQPAPGGKRL